MPRLLLALLLLLAPTLASAQATSSRLRFRTLTGSNYLLNQVAANASAGSRTVTVSTGGYSKVSWTFGYTQAAGTAITMTCQGSTDRGTTFGDITAMSISGGTGTLSVFTWTQAIAASGATIIDMASGSYDALKCVFGITGGAGSDLINVSGIAGAG
jgi:hypothetical protein